MTMMLYKVSAPPTALPSLPRSSHSVPHPYPTIFSPTLSSLFLPSHSIPVLHPCERGMRIAVSRKYPQRNLAKSGRKKNILIKCDNVINLCDVIGCRDVHQRRNARSQGRRPVNVKHDARCVMGKVGGGDKKAQNGVNFNLLL